VHAAREAALRRDSRGGIHATAGKAVFPSPFFPSQVLEERRKRKPISGERQRTTYGLAGEMQYRDAGAWMDDFGGGRD
jgi:hypothetical protein